MDGWMNESKTIVYSNKNQVRLHQKLEAMNESLHSNLDRNISARKAALQENVKNFIFETNNEQMRMEVLNRKVKMGKHSSVFLAGLKKAIASKKVGGGGSSNENSDEENEDEDNCLPELFAQQSRVSLCYCHYFHLVGALKK